MEEQIVLVKLFNGEMILGSRSGDPSGSMFNLTLRNPRQVAIMPTMAGSVKVALGSVCEPFRVKRLEDEVTFPMAQVMFVLEEGEIDTELVNGYKSEISGIKIASAAETASINSGADGGFSI